MRTMVENDITAVKWLGNKSVIIASIYRGKNPVDKVKRWCSKTKMYTDTQRPAVVREYNAFMGGVDLHDMQVELYRTDIRAKRFYLRIVFHLIDTCVVNTWLLYRRHCVQKNCKHITLLKFKLFVTYCTFECR